MTSPTTQDATFSSVAHPSEGAAKAPDQDGDSRGITFARWSPFLSVARRRLRSNTAMIGGASG